LLETDMSEPNQSLEEFLFEAALTKHPAEERVAFLEGVCRDNPALRARLEVLLEGHFQAAGFLADSTNQIEQKAAPRRTEGEAGSTVIGRYKLLERIGEGGFGEVWMAEQKEPVKRRVALKIIKLGMDTKQVVARFEAERQALALMDHANIAKVLDAAATDTGRPYFVMELVRGVRITDYCDHHQLPTQERLQLFIQVCRAIQHAHQKGIIHRDIKPSNILVTLHDGLPVPKVIDFGIAKATQLDLTEKTLFTQFHQFMGTPAYVSPEQAEMSGLDVDTRSDIYSLGVLLYELLTGQTPFDSKELLAAGLDELRRRIREIEPVRPSTRLSAMSREELTTTAQRRGAEPPRLIHQVRGDLDWIVMKCLEKDRARRYETAKGLARDIERHLGNEPVMARPPSRLYEFRKTVRRHWVGFAAVGAVVAALAVGVAVSTLEAVRARQAEQDQNRLRYASDMNVARQALEENNLGRALDLLNRQRPASGQKDLRGWEWRYLWQQTRSDALFTLRHESDPIISLAASPDGNWLAIGTHHQGGLSVWDLRTRRMAVRLAKNEDNVQAVFSPTDPLLAFTSQAVTSSGQVKNTLRLWNTSTHRLEAEFPLEGKGVGIAFGDDGRTLVTSTSSGVQGQITLWRIPGATRLATFLSEQADYDIGTCFAATPDLSFAAYVLAGGGRLRVVDLHAGKELWTAVGANERVTALAFSPDGKTLASGGGFIDTNRNIRLWNVASGKVTGELEGHSFWIGSLVFWPDGKSLASSSADQTLRVWDVKSHECRNVLRGHRQEVWRLALLPDNKTLVSGAKDGAICFWDASVMHPRQPYITIPENTATWCFTPDSRSVLTVSQQGRASRWTGSDFQYQEPLVEMGTNWDELFQFSADGRFLAVGSSDGLVRIWDTSGRALRRQWTNATGKVLSLTFLASGNKLIGQSVSDHLFHEWDLATGLELRSWRGPDTFRFRVALPPDETACVTIDYDGGVVLRNLADNSKPKLDLDVWEGLGGSFSPDGKLFAVASGLGYARVWDTATWGQKATLGGFFNNVSSICFSPDIKRLATGVGNPPGDMLKLWDVHSWQEVFTFDSQFGALIGAAFSPDGNTIGTTEYDGSVHRVYLRRAPSWAEIEAAEQEQATNAGTKSD
jgi:WD40 repeat protein/serine/threonine protein kinase